MSRISKSTAGICLPVLVSWLIAAAFPLLPWVSYWQTLPPEVPFLLTPHASGEHVRSSVFYLITVLGFGVLAALPLELSKYEVSKHHRPSFQYLILTLQQFAVGADVIRSYAWDWWLFLLSMTRIKMIDRYSWMERHVSTVGRWPWPSAILCVAIVVLLLTRNTAIESSDGNRRS